jgi:hypothetical protein
MKFSKTGIALAAALGTVSALGLASEANAGAVAYATLDITNFRLSSGGQVLDAGAFSQLGILNTVGASGSLNGVTQAFTNPPSPGPSDVALQCVGACGMGQNNFALQPVLSSGNFGRGDANLTGALITGVADGANAAHAQGVAEVQVNGVSFGSGTSTISTSAGFTFTLGGTGSTTIRADFDAASTIRAIADATGLSADAQISWTATITRVSDNSTVFSWSPDGQVGGITGGTEISDAYDLTDTVNAFGLNQDIAETNSGHFAAEVTLLNGVAYRLSIQQTQIANAVSVVPEPGTLALVASSLLGLGFAARRRKA